MTPNLEFRNLPVKIQIYIQITKKHFWAVTNCQTFPHMVELINGKTNRPISDSVKNIKLHTTFMPPLASQAKRSKRRKYPSDISPTL